MLAERSSSGLPVIGVRLAEGRTGSTLLMQLLGTSAKIAFDRRYPSEYRFLSYFVRMSEQMTEPFDELRHVRVTPFFFGERPSWGPVPFESAIVEMPRLTAPLLRSMWSAVSCEIEAVQPDVRFYAEKLAVPVDPLRDAGLDLRVVDVVRDPRDMLASIRAFTSRGIDGFQRHAGQSEQEYLEAFVARMRGQLTLIRDTPPDVDRVVVRYEDLVRDLDGTARHLGTWLDVSLDADAVLANREEYRHHMTSESIEGSIGRWERDLAPAEADLICTELGPVMEPFGYSF